LFAVVRVGWCTIGVQEVRVHYPFFVNLKVHSQTNDVGDETGLVMHRIRAVLAAVGLSMNDVCKTTIFMTDFEDYSIVTEVHGEYFETLPARSTVKVAELLMGARVEIESVAVRSS
jgi:2-iminobutanoate/2-iminopropanoate deaminase